MRRRLLAIAGVLALAGAAAAAWQLAPHATHATLADVFAAAERWRHSAWAAPLLLAAFLLGGLVAFPVNLLIALAVVVLGPWAGAPCALVGALLSAIESKTVSPGQVSAARRTQILANPDAGLKARAEKLFGQTSTGSRAEVVAQGRGAGRAVGILGTPCSSTSPSACSS